MQTIARFAHPRVEITTPGSANLASARRLQSLAGSFPRGFHRGCIPREVTGGNDLPKVQLGVPGLAAFGLFDAAAQRQQRGRPELQQDRSAEVGEHRPLKA